MDGKYCFESYSFVQTNLNTWNLKRHIWNCHLRKTDRFSFRYKNKEKHPKWEEISKELRLSKEIEKYFKVVDEWSPNEQNEEIIYLQRFSKLIHFLIFQNIPIFQNLKN